VSRSMSPAFVPVVSAISTKRRCYWLTKHNASSLSLRGNNIRRTSAHNMNNVEWTVDLACHHACSLSGFGLHLFRPRQLMTFRSSNSSCQNFFTVLIQIIEVQCISGDRFGGDEFFKFGDRLGLIWLKYLSNHVSIFSMYLSNCSKLFAMLKNSNDFMVTYKIKLKITEV
jgi:hypothetical protein